MRSRINLFTLLLLAFVSCQREDSEQIGPDLAIAEPETFMFLSPFGNSTDSVNLNNNGVYFEAEFSQNVQWELRLRGVNSGAEYLIQGISDKLDSTNSYWDGAILMNEDLRLFEAETVQVDLSILGLDSTFSSSFEITETKTPHLIFSRFESNAVLSSPWFSSSDNADPFSVSVISGDAAEGSSFVELTGKDDNSSFFTGSYGLGNLTPFDQSLPSADSVYFNVFIKGNGASNTTQLEMQVREFFGDAFAIKLDMSHEGWKYYSIRYDEILTVYGQDAGGGTAGLQEPQFVNEVSFIVSSVPEGNSVRTGIDFWSLSIGKPLFDL